MPPIEALSESTEIDGSMPLEGYRAMSLLAMTALGLGLLSSIAVFSTLLGFVPLAAMALGAYALRRISVHSDRLSGRWMAVAPLILAPLFLGWGVSRDFSRQERVCGQARQFADEWLSILNRKETLLAHQLRVSSKNRLDLHLNMAVAYQRNETATEDLQLFLDNSPTREILAAAPHVRFQFEEFSRQLHHGFTDSITMQYVFQTPSSDKTRFWITAERSYSIYTDRADWQISEISVQMPRRT